MLHRSFQKLRRRFRTKRKQPDLRGKHTKKSRLAKKLEFETYLNTVVRRPSCTNCHGSVFVPTNDQDALVCTTCGMVSNNLLIEGATDITESRPRSALYRQRNYFAECVLHATASDPRFTSSEQYKINLVWSELHDKDPDTWTNCGRSFSKFRFQQICRILDKIEPNKRWKQKLERWLQAKQIIFGVDDDFRMPDEFTSATLKILFDPIAKFFETKFKKNEPGHHNIPKMDLIFLVLLYNIAPEAVVQHGWYFLSKNIIWPTCAIEKDYKRIYRITKAVNAEFLRKNRQPHVRSESYAWLNKHKYKVPTLETIVLLALSSHEGRNTLHHLVNDQDYNFIIKPREQ